MSLRTFRTLLCAAAGTCLVSAAWAAGPGLVWRGDVATQQAVIEGAAKAWQASGHGRLQVQPFNTASGLDAVAHGSADIAGSARPDNGSAQESALTFTPVAWDALVLITHPANPVSSLTLKQVHDIYYGRIHNWKEVGGKDEPIDVYAVASPGDGVEFSLRKLLFGRGNQPVAAPRLYVNTTQLEQGVTLDPKSLGVTTLARAAGKSKLKMIRIDGTAPSLSNVASGRYKLFAPIYLVTNPSGPHAKEAEAFVDFVQSGKADAALRQHDVLPYHAGAALAAMDVSRRSQILAAVGAHAPVATGGQNGTGVVAPGATYAAQAARAPTSERTGEARRALEEKRAEARRKASEKAAARLRKASLAGVKGEAVTVDTAAARGKSFAKVSASANVHARTRHYTVAAGDTLSSIAHAHKVSVDDLRHWNGLHGNTVRVGQVLRLSAR